MLPKLVLLWLKNDNNISIDHQLPRTPYQPKHQSHYLSATFTMCKVYECVRQCDCGTRFDLCKGCFAQNDVDHFYQHRVKDPNCAQLCPLNECEVVDEIKKYETYTCMRCTRARQEQQGRYRQKMREGEGTYRHPSPRRR